MTRQERLAAELRDEAVTARRMGRFYALEAQTQNSIVLALASSVAYERAALREIEARACLS